MADYDEGRKDIMMMKRDWGKIHRFEEREKIAFLKKLTVKESFRIFCDFYELAYSTKSRREFLRLNPEKINALKKIKAIFSMVDASRERHQ